MSIAYSPDDGLLQEPGPISSANHHGVAAADAAALAACNAAKAAGKQRLEGKEYIVQDGDIISFRFNV